MDQPPLTRFPKASCSNWSASALAVIYGILQMEGVKWRGLRFSPATVVQLSELADRIRTEPLQLDLEKEAA